MKLLYVDVVRRCQLDDELRPCTIFDSYGVHTVNDVVSEYIDKDWPYNVIPKGFTSELQPADLTFNKPFKNGLAGQFRGYFSTEVVKQVNNGVPPRAVKVDTKLSTIKNRHFNWQVKAYNDVSSDTIVKGFRKMGFMDYYYGDKKSSDYNWDV